MLTVTTFRYMNHPVRVVETDGKIYFVIRDICDIIKLSNPNQALSRYTNNVPLYNRILTPGGLQIVRLVPEPISTSFSANTKRGSRFSCR